MKEALQDTFLQNIQATAGPAAYYKENRLSGLYKKVPMIGLPTIDDLTAMHHCYTILHQPVVAGEDVNSSSIYC